ncbi:MAG: hypothetical protein ACYS30_18550 [Planctomycetota bacterium]
MKTWSGENVFSRVNKLLCVMFLLFVVSAVNAAPTIGSGNSNVAGHAVSADSDVHVSVVPVVTEIVESHGSPLAAVAGEFLKPPASLTSLAASQAIHTRTLPVVPGAVFMVLAGFLCVSLVRDRRVWLGALAGLLWAGQTGIQALPQLALRLSPGHNIKQQLCAVLTYPYYLENPFRLRSDIEGTQYIGLLHHLAGIPDAKSASTSARLCAIIPEHYSLSSLLNRLVAKARQFICFSPAFIFDILPRGPPKPA